MSLYYITIIKLLCSSTFSRFLAIKKETGIAGISLLLSSTFRNNKPLPRLFQRASVSKSDLMESRKRRLWLRQAELQMVHLTSKWQQPPMSRGHSWATNHSQLASTLSLIMVTVNHARFNFSNTKTWIRHPSSDYMYPSQHMQGCKLILHPRKSHLCFELLQPVLLSFCSLHDPFTTFLFCWKWW